LLYQLSYSSALRLTICPGQSGADYRAAVLTGQLSGYIRDPTGSHLGYAPTLARHRAAGRVSTIQNTATVTANPLLLLPDFAVILFGAVLARVMKLGDEFWSGAEKLVYYVLFPPLLFMAINQAHFSVGDAAQFVIAGVITFCISVMMSFMARPLLNPPADVFAACVQTGFRYNSYIGLALSASLWGTKGVALFALLIAFCIPLANVAAVYALAKHQDRHLGRELIRNPLIIATVAGLVSNLVGLTLPDVVSSFLQRLGNASLALGLLCIGAGLKLSATRTATGTLTYFTVLKLVGVPLIAWVLIVTMKLNAFDAAVLLLFSALPTASSAYILATRMGGNGAPVAAIVSAQTLLSMLTLPLIVAFAPK
jgi:malonate transporter and related proteins